MRLVNATATSHPRRARTLRPLLLPRLIRRWWLKITTEAPAFQPRRGGSVVSAMETWQRIPHDFEELIHSQASCVTESGITLSERSVLTQAPVSCEKPEPDVGLALRR